MDVSGRRPTMNDVAARSGVSRAAVSYVLGGRTDKSVSDATRARILAAADELGYVTNAAAASLRLGHSTVALLVVDEMFTGEVSERTLRSMTEGVRDIGLTPLVHTLHSEPELLDVVAAVRPVAVVLLTLVTGRTRDLLGRSGADHVVGLPSPSGSPGPADRVAERAIGAAQAGHLLDRGHRALAYFLPDGDSPRLGVAESRLLGAQEECARRAVQEPVVLRAPSDRDAVAARIQVARAAGVTAIAAHNDQAALALLAAAADLGLTVPGDLAVVGADDSPESRLATPQISTVVMAFDAERSVPSDWIRHAMAPDEQSALADAPRTSDDRHPTGLPPIAVVARATT